MENVEPTEFLHFAFRLQPDSAIISGVAGLAPGQEGGDDLPRARIAGTRRVVTASLLLVTARACERQVARIVGASQACGQVGRGAVAEPAAGDNVLEGGSAERLAVFRDGEVSAAVQAPGVSQAVFGPRLRVGIERDANELPERARHGVGNHPSARLVSHCPPSTTSVAPLI
jgi:hypothetical protein